MFLNRRLDQFRNEKGMNKDFKKKNTLHYILHIMKNVTKKMQKYTRYKNKNIINIYGVYIYRLNIKYLKSIHY